MKEVAKIAGLLALLVGLMLFVAWSQNPGNFENLKEAFQPTRKQESGQQASIKTLKIGSREFKVEIADTPAARSRGLSGRGQIAENEGMLFVFEKEDVRPAFWMKDMKFAIDIIWINEGSVVQITPNAKPPKAGTADEDIELLLPESPVDLVLEIRAGEAEKQGIKLGDRVELGDFADQ